MISIIGSSSSSSSIIIIIIIIIIDSIIMFIISISMFMYTVIISIVSITKHRLESTTSYHPMKQSRLCFKHLWLPCRPLPYPTWSITCRNSTALHDHLITEAGLAGAGRPRAAAALAGRPARGARA